MTAAGLRRQIEAWSGWRRWFLATGLGILAAGALPPLHFVFLLLPAFSGFIWLIDTGAGKRSAFVEGWGFGFGFFTAGLFWISFALLTKPDQFAWLVPIAVFGLPALLAFNMTTMLRNEFEAAVGGSWDLRRFQQSVLRAGGRIVKHARRVCLHIEESVGSFWKVMTKQIGQLRLASRWNVPRGAGHRDWVPPPPHSHRSLVLRG